MKRQKLHVNMTKFNNFEKLTEQQIHDLMQRIIQLTDNWPSQELESLYASLALVIENSEDDIYLYVNECLTHFQEGKNSADTEKALVKTC